jgi:hypothetical protein
VTLLRLTTEQFVIVRATLTTLWCNYFEALSEKLVRDIMHEFHIDGDAGKERPGRGQRGCPGKDKCGSEP